MTAHDHGDWTRGHFYLSESHGRSERRAGLAMAVTALFMAVEIGCGLAYHSMALLADGVHMATHVGALGLAAAAYWLARRHAQNKRFTFGSGKFGDLAGFASAIILGLVALGVAAESVQHLIAPIRVQFGDALLIACIGLGVNLLSALILRGTHGHEVGHAHHDHNMRAAYTHVLADAAISLLAIFALGAGYLYGLAFLDSVIGIIGALVIASWAYGLIRDSALVLLDAEDDPGLAAEIRTLIEQELRARVADLHLWRLGPGHRGLIVSLVSPAETDSERIKSTLRARYTGLSHVTVEVAICADCAGT